jgi:hypothetical protein
MNILTILEQLQRVPLGGSTGPRRTSPALRFSVVHPGPAQPRSQHDGASFFGQQSIRTRQILLEFYPPVQITSQFMSHDRELWFAWKGNSDQNISLKVLARKTWPLFNTHMWKMLCAKVISLNS